MLYVPSFRRNLISSGLLEIAGMKQVIEAGKLVLTKNGEFVGKAYRVGVLYVLQTVIENEMNAAFAYVAESLDLWHVRLGHSNVKSVKKLHDMGLILKLNSKDHSQCGVCVEAKYRKKPFNSVKERTTELLELVHSDIAVFKDIESRVVKDIISLLWMTILGIRNCIYLGQKMRPKILFMYTKQK